MLTQRPLSFYIEIRIVDRDSVRQRIIFSDFPAVPCTGHPSGKTSSIHHMKGACKMKKMKKRWLSALLTAITVICLFQTTAFAAVTRKCYTISSGNTTVYSNTGLTTRYGSIYGSDEVTVLDVTSRYCRVTYPISGGRTKTGYIPTSAILRGTSGNSYKSRGKVTTYKRPGGGTYGYVSKGDTVTVLGTYGNYTQLKYPVSGGYKYAFVTTGDYNNYIKPNNNNNNNNPTQSSSGWQMPMQNAYVCGNNWLTYYSARPSRPYHLGLDLASRNGNAAVYAAAYGTVAATGYNNSNGNYVILRHSLSGKTIYSFYCHLSGGSITVSKGKNVSKGQKIAVFGNTGSASRGRHLHFAITNALYSGGGYYGYGTEKSGNRVSYSGVVYYNPTYVVNYGRLP